MVDRLLLCTDMDRTVIPNGFESEDKQARSAFTQFCQSPDVTLVYVTGRDQARVKQAIKSYQLPQPNYVITDVGTKIYRVTENGWQEMPQWEIEIAQDWRQLSRQAVKAIIGEHRDLRMQEMSKQNTHKLSYYLPLHVDKDTIIQAIDSRLQAESIQASLVWSIDEPNGIGLLDVLPLHATKLHAIKFLKEHLGYEHPEVVFAGDSGNDLPVLESDVQSVLVSNASDDVKASAMTLAKAAGHQDTLYLATGEGFSMNGNYSAGVLEGVWHFKPEFHPTMGDLIK
jgi:hypothetical protein